MRLTRVTLALASLLFFAAGAFACTCVDGPLKKRYREAKAVFVSGIYDFKQEDVPNIQNYRDGLPVLLVKRSWKGIEKELVAIDFDFPEQKAACPWLYEFDEGSDYLVFAYGNNLAVRVQCSDTHKLTTEYNQTIRDISLLDSGWFRFKASIWPF